MTNCLTTCFYRFCQCAFYRPAFEKSTAQRADVDSNFVRPVCQAESFAVKSDESSRSLISSLLFCSCPFAVLRPTIRHALLAMTTGIAFRIVYSFNAVSSGWFRSHVVGEVLRRLPSLAYCFAVSAIVWKGYVVRIIAATVHCLPRTVFRCVSHSVMPFTAWLATVTTVPSQLISSDQFFCSALAETGPVNVPRWMAWCLCNYCPFTKSLPGQIYETRTMLGRLVFSHDASLISRVVRTARQLQLSGCSHYITYVMDGIC